MSAMSHSGALPGSPASTGQPSRLRIWFQAVRFFSFTASIVPIVVGSALALVDRTFDVVLFLAMLVASVATHAGANMANDYFDHKKGVDTDESLGPSKVIQLGYLTPSEVLRGTIVAFALATVLGLFIVYQTGVEILVLALFSLAAAVLYTGGPKPFGYIALGEVLVFIFMGPVMVTGAYYVHAGEVTPVSALLALPIGCLVAAILHVNNIRDIDFDRNAGKRTLANVLGRRNANLEYAGLVLGAYVFIAVIIGVDMSLWTLALTVASLPAAIRLVQVVFGDSGTHELNQALRKTAGLHLQFGVLVTLGLVLRTLIDRFS
jgi:1,4-dihydroxy-2-naphthoate polyprenyltransferase